MSEEWETREQLLDAADEAGYSLSAPQLGRLYRAGLIPAPEVKALGRGRGTESRFPPGSAARLIRVAEVHAKVHRLADLAWRLWWEDGGEIPPAALEALRRVASSVEVERERLATRLEKNEAGIPEGVAGLDKLYADAESSHLPGALAELRRNVGRQHFGSVVHGLAAAASGRPQDTAYSDEELDVLTRRTFGFGPAQPDHEGGEPSSEHQAQLHLDAFAELSTARMMTELADSDSAELDRARVQAQSLIEMVSATASLFERFGGRGAPSLGPASRLLAGERHRDQMLFLLAVLALRSNTEFRDDLEKVDSVRAPQAVATDQMYALLRTMREEIPVLAGPMNDDRLAAAIHDRDAAADLHAEIRRLRERNRKQFDAFFAAHPEADELTAALEATRDPGS